MYFCSLVLAENISSSETGCWSIQIELKEKIYTSVFPKLSFSTSKEGRMRLFKQLKPMSADVSSKYCESITCLPENSPILKVSAYNIIHQKNL